MTFSDVIMWIMAIGAIIGGIDRIIGNKFGLGEQFEEGFNAMGPLALGMVGMVCLSPVIANVIAPAITPFFKSIGADPSIFAGLLLPNDTGGYPLAEALAIDKQAGLYSGLIVASMMGCAIVFCIPVGLSMIEKKDQPFFSQGLLIGLITVPAGSITGGMIAGFDKGMILINSVPVIVIAILLALGLKFIPDSMIKGCTIFGRIIMIIITIGLVSGAFEGITGVAIIPGLAPISDGLAIIGTIGMVLLGTFPILTILTRLLNKPLTAIGTLFKLDATSAAGLIFCLANPVPVFKMFKDMNNRGKVINIAWMVCATAALGDHLGFTAGVYPTAITAVVVGKLIGGILAVVIAFFMTGNIEATGEAATNQVEA
ncbi:MAG: ethanolamine utilization protein EutH [Synergistaceae bacterium]|nr:ethanolamine utilization protein EutH [Synergistaceae bacterium]